MRCTAITQKGSKCRNEAVEDALCRIHKNMEGKKPARRKRNAMRRQRNGRIISLDLNSEIGPNDWLRLRSQVKDISRQMAKTKQDINKAKAIGNMAEAKRLTLLREDLRKRLAAVRHRLYLVERGALR